MRNFCKLPLILAVFAFYTLTAVAKPNKIADPLPKREFRGVWIATVVNIDWPSVAGLSSQQQQQELINILDNHQRAGINAIILQVRPTADAFYAKSQEPWSRFLTGVPGKPPVPFYDPLEFAINEAHKRGMELHAWINPYRATFDLVSANTTTDHITRRKPEWFFTYGGKKLFNPGIPEVRAYIVGIIMDIVRNYDIDGIHLDDYFYPYPVGSTPIPDADTFRRYPNGIHNLADWRRNNVNVLVSTLSDSIHTAKKYVKFGISPFGIWDNLKDDPRGSQTGGFSGNRQLYGDALAWLNNGWVDYINPQLYFPFGHRTAAFEVLADWWAQHAAGRDVYIGHAAYRAGEKATGWQSRSQIPDQVRYIRKNTAIQGSVYYSSKHLSSNLIGLRDTLQYNLYRYKSLPPRMPWLDDVAPEPPKNLEARAMAGNAAVILHWEAAATAPDGDQAYGYVIYRFNQGESIDLDNPQNILYIGYDSEQLSYADNQLRSGAKYTYVVTALDRLKNESLPSNSQQVVLR